MMLWMAGAITVLVSSSAAAQRLGDTVLLQVLPCFPSVNASLQVASLQVNCSGGQTGSDNDFEDDPGFDSNVYHRRVDHRASLSREDLEGKVRYNRNGPTFSVQRGC